MPSTWLCTAMHCTGEHTYDGDGAILGVSICCLLGLKRSSDEILLQMQSVCLLVSRLGKAVTIVASGSAGT
jgi:hypothetical protein